jgi:hypothetical protein
MYTGRRSCYQCPENMARQCELEFGTDGIPPCTKDIVENFNSLQQLKAEIANYADKLDSTYKEDIPIAKSVVVKILRQLSAV